MTDIKKTEDEAEAEEISKVLKKWNSYPGISLDDALKECREINPAFDECFLKFFINRLFTHESGVYEREIRRFKSAWELAGEVIKRCQK